MLSRIFHTAKIEERVYHALISADGPTIATADNHGAVAIGPSYIDTAIVERERLHGRVCICKYDPHQPRIDIDAHSERGIAEIYNHFGLARRKGHPVFTHLHPFYRSLAFGGLIEWVKAHPKAARAAAALTELSYLGDWHEAALKGQPTEIVLRGMAGGMH